jgi:hypothetical protein
MPSAHFYFELLPTTLTKLADPRSAPSHVQEEEGQQLEQPQPQQVPPHPMLTAGKALGLYAAGTAAGYGGLLGARGVRNILRARKGLPPTELFQADSVLPHALPALAGIGTVAFEHAQHSLFDRMRADAEARRKLRGG